MNFHSDCAGGGMEEKSEMAAEGKEGSAEQEQVDKSRGAPRGMPVSSKNNCCSDGRMCCGLAPLYLLV